MDMVNLSLIYHTLCTGRKGLGMHLHLSCPHMPLQFNMQSIVG